MNEEVLHDLVYRGDLSGTLAFFRGMRERERKAFSGHARRLFKEQGLMRVEHCDPQWSAEAKVRSAKRSSVQSHKKVAAFTAVVASCNVSSVRAAHQDMHLIECIEYISSESDAAPVDALADRSPPWVQSYADWLAKQAERWWGFGSWLLIWRMVRRGLCERPGSPEYFRLFSRAVWVSHRKNQAANLEDFAAREFRSIEPDVWGLFSVDGIVTGDEWSMKEGTWFGVLPRLAERGILPRDRLLTETLAALQRDFREVQLRWYIKFHDQLKPTPEERATLLKDYLALLGNKIPSIVKLAVAALEVLYQAGKVDPEVLVDALPRAFAAKTKGVANSALALLKAIGSKNKSMAPAIAAAAAKALSHPAADVNERAVVLIESIAKPANEDVVTAVLSQLDHTVPTARTRLQQWIGKSAPSQDSHAGVDMAQLQARAEQLPERFAKLAGLVKGAHGLAPARLAFRRLQVPCLDPDARIDPIRDLDELVEVATAQLVDPNDNEEVERIYDGIARLGAERPPHFADLTSQLLKHIEGTWWHAAGTAPGMLRFIVHAWVIHGLIPREPGSMRFCPRFLQERAAAITERFTKGISQGLLSFPTHRGCWIDSRILVERALHMQEVGGVTDRIDWLLALLRLAPDGRDKALAAATNVHGEEGAALRYALGGPLEESIDSSWLWAAASRARDPDSVDEVIARQFPILAAEQVRPGEFKVSVEERQFGFGVDSATVLDVATTPSMQEGRDTAHIALLFQTDGRPGRNTYCFMGLELLDIRWVAGLWPTRREPYCALAASELGDNIDWQQRRWGDRAWFEPLLDPDCEMEEMANLLLAVGLASKEPGQAGLATDILIAAIADGRVDGEFLGTTLGSLLFTGVIKPSRWASTLGEAARVSALHGQQVRRAIERALADAKGNPPHGLHSLVELLHQLAVEAGAAVDDRRTRDFLSTITGSSKLARSAKKLLALNPDPASPHDALSNALAIEGRIVRAERWARWASGDRDA